MRTLSCIECGQSFDSIEALQRHIRLKSTRERSALLGCRVSVMWAHSKWYEGWVLEYDVAEGKHRVDYDDGERKWYNMSGKTFYIIRRPSESKEEPWLDDYFSDPTESANYAVAQSRVHRAFNRPQQVGYRTSGHLCITLADRTDAQEAGSSLLYGEVLPRGVGRMLDRRHLDAPSAESLYDLGMGTGKLALQAWIQHPTLRYVYGVEIAGSRFEIAEAALVNLVSLFPEQYALLNHVRERAISAVCKSDGRIIKFEHGNLLAVEGLETADIVILQTNIPAESYRAVCGKIVGMRDGARLLTYLNIGSIWMLDRFPFQQLGINVSGNDRFSTSWSVHRGCHFFLWTKVTDDKIGVHGAHEWGDTHHQHFSTAPMGPRATMNYMHRVGRRRTDEVGGIGSSGGGGGLRSWRDAHMSDVRRGSGGGDQSSDTGCDREDKSCIACAKARAAGGFDAPRGTGRINGGSAGGGSRRQAGRGDGGDQRRSPAGRRECGLEVARSRSRGLEDHRGNSDGADPQDPPHPRGCFFALFAWGRHHRAKRRLFPRNRVQGL